MGRKRGFLGFLVTLFVAFFAFDAYAGYSCPTTKTYTSCDENYYLSDESTSSSANSCQACPSNSTKSGTNATTSCTCITGYATSTTVSSSGVASRVTTGATNETPCDTTLYSLTLDANDGTTSISKIYLKYATGIYTRATTGGVVYAFDKVGTYGCNTAMAGCSRVAPPTRTGYEFMGYYTSTSGGSQVIDSNGYLGSGYTSTMFTGNRTLYAQWSKVSYIVTYNCGDGSGTAPSSQITSYNSSLSIPTAGSCVAPDYGLGNNDEDGLRFAGWAVSGTEEVIPAGSTYTWNYTSGKTLSAVWEPIKFEVTYDCNGGTAEFSGYDNTATYGEYYETLPLGACTPPSGKVQLYWLTNQTEDQITPGNSYLWAEPGNQTLVAVYGSSSLLISFEKNGGSGTTPASIYCTSGSECSLPDGKSGSFYKTGYYFKGWATSSSATSGSTSMTFTENTKLYAVWGYADGYTCSPGSTKITSCYLDCAAGTEVTTIGGSCEAVPVGESYWTGAHRVYNGQISGRNYCPSHYYNGDTYQSGTTGAASSEGYCSYNATAGTVLTETINPLLAVEFNFSRAAVVVSELDIYVSDGNGGETLLTNPSSVITNYSGISQLFDGKESTNINMGTYTSFGVYFRTSLNVTRVVLHMFRYSSSYNTLVTIRAYEDTSNYKELFYDVPLYVYAGANSVIFPDNSLLFSFPLKFYTTTTCTAGTARAAHTYSIRNGVDTCDICDDWNYSSSDGAASCTSCPSVTSGWTPITNTSGAGWTSYYECFQIKQPENCTSGLIYQNASSASAWGAVENGEALSANAGYRVTDGNGNYVADGWGVACEKCTAGSYCRGNGRQSDQVACAIGSTSEPGAPSCTACAAGTTTSAAGATSCSSSCDNTRQVYAWLTPQWNTDNTVSNLCHIKSCNANNYLSSSTDSGYTGACLLCSDISGTGGLYTTSEAANSLDATSCFVTVPAGQYIASVDATSLSTCPTGSYCPGMDVHYDNYDTTGGRLLCSDISGTGGLYANSAAGSVDKRDCYVETNQGYYIRNLSDEEQYICKSGSYCPGGITVRYPNTGTDGGMISCPAPTTYNPDELCGYNGNECGTIVSSDGTTSQATYNLFSWVLADESVTGATAASSSGAYKPEQCIIDWLYYENSDGDKAMRKCFWDEDASNYSASCHDFRYFSCSAGTYDAQAGSGNSDTSCETCPEGSYCPGGSQTSSAGATIPADPEICPAGSYCLTGVSSPTACTTGSYTNATGKSACTACTDGKTTSGTGQTSCNATCENDNFVASWAETSWTANSVTNMCVIDECNVGYTVNTGANTCSIINYMIIYNTNGGENSANNPSKYNVNSSDITLENPTRDNSTFVAWYENEDFEGNAVSTIVSGTTGDIELWAKWECNDGYEEDGNACIEKAPEYTCEPGEYIDGTNCVTCPEGSYCTGGTEAPTSCSGATSGEYPSSAAGAKSEEECYTECTTECTKPSSCPQGFQTCTYITGTSVNGVKYKDKSCEFSEGTDCKLNLQKSYCLPGRYMMNESPYCDNYCADLSPQESIPESVTEPVNGWYTSSSLANITAGPRACSSMLCTPNCNVENSLVLNTDDQNADDYGFVIGTENFCPTNAESCNVKIPTSGNIVYPRLSCIPHSNFCSFTFTCKSGYTPSTTNSVNFGYRTTGSNLTTIYKAKTNASCNPNTYTFVFEQNGGVGGQANSVYYLYNDAWYSDEGKTTKIEAVGRPSKAGYVFDGYGVYSVLGLAKPDVLVTDGDGKILDILDESRVNALGDLKIGDASGTVYAAWTPITYNVVYDANGGSGDAPMAPVSCTYDADCVTPKNTYAKTGYTFAGWKCTGGDSNGICDGDIIGEGGSIANATVVNGATIKLTAQWVPNTYTIEFNANKPTKASSDVTGQMDNMTMTYEKSAELTENDFELTGWLFANWNTKSDGTGTSYTNKQTVKNISTEENGAVVLYAQWTAKKYTIEFNANKPTNASSDVTGEMNNMSMKYDDAKNLTENSYQLKGWVFNGWSGSDGKTYTNGQSVKNLTTENSATITLSAQWEPNVFEITLDENFDGGNKTTVYQKYDTGWYSDKNLGNKITSVDVVDRGVAYKFLGFFTEQENGEMVIDANAELPETNTFDENTTLYAQWEVQTRNCVEGEYYPTANDQSSAICPINNYCSGNGYILGDESGCNTACPDGGLTEEEGTINVTDCYRNFAEGDEYNGKVWNFDNGTANWTCTYNESDNAYADCKTNVLTCDGGYYKPNDSIACSKVTNGYYSEDDLLTQTQCPEKDEYTVYSDGNQDSITNCYVDCNSYTPHVENALEDGVYVAAGTEIHLHYKSGAYANCQYTVECKDGYSATSGAAPACNAKEYSITLDKNGGNGTNDIVNCTFDSGKCALPAIDFDKTGYVSVDKWCTEYNGGTCFDAGTVVTSNISSNGNDIVLYAQWTPGIFKIELAANDATENATQNPIYLKYATGWYSDSGASNAITSIGTSLPSKPSYEFAGFNLNNVMIVDANGNLNTSDTAKTSTAKDATAMVAWSNGMTTCAAGTYHNGGDTCTTCPKNHYCPGGKFATNSGKASGLNACPTPAQPNQNVTVESEESSASANACNGVFPYETNNAKGVWTCNFDNETNGYTNCDENTVDITWCASGYWYNENQTKIDCVEVGTDYYSPDADKNKYICPNNGTTKNVTTASSVQMCSKIVDYVSGSKQAQGTYECFANEDNADNTIYDFKCDMNTIVINWCAGGYWYDKTQSTTDCVEVGINHYSQEGDMEKHACPYGGETTLTTATSPDGVCRMSVAYPNDTQTDLDVNGTGTQGCFYDSMFDDGQDNGKLNGYTSDCESASITKCNAGFYWADKTNTKTPVCVLVGYNFYGPVVEAGSANLTARAACPNGGLTINNNSADASACYLEKLACDIENGSGEQTCNFGDKAYDANCTECIVTECDDNFSQVGNACVGCPEDNVCKNAQQYTCAELTNGTHTKADAGTTDEAYCFKDCALFENAYTMSGRDYFTATDTCKITMCVDGYTLINGKCELCPAGSICTTDSATPISCADLTDGEYPMSKTGGDSIEDCYQVCQEYKVEYGTAIPTKDGTVNYPNTCEFTCISDTGNPGEIINGRCVETSCNYNFEKINGLCQLCNRDNALSYSKNGNCVIEACVAGFHPSEQGCESNVVTCSAPNAISAEQVWNTEKKAFSECRITKCANGYHIDQNVCQIDEQACEVENGIGVREWDANKNAWGECIATECEPGYTTNPNLTNEQWKQCGQCNNMYSAYGELAASSYVRECEIASCMYQGEKYILENNECRLICVEKSDDTGSRRWNGKTKRCESICEPGYISW